MGFGGKPWKAGLLLAFGLDCWAQAGTEAQTLKVEGVISVTVGTVIVVSLCFEEGRKNTENKEDHNRKSTPSVSQVHLAA